tara:strand:+ start:862 stop:1005 length:144 start_codon:yes stop_codon:yes gene_type:complete
MEQLGLTISPQARGMSHRIRMRLGMSGLLTKATLAKLESCRVVVLGI